MRIRLWSGVLAIGVAAAPGAAAQQATQEFRVDAAASTVRVQVGRAGLLSFAGHNHEVSAPALRGSVVLDPQDISRSHVVLTFDAGEMKVTGRGETAADVPEVQRIMLSDRVLDVMRYPTITFESDRVAVRRQSTAHLELLVNGRLTLRGTSRQVSVPITLQHSEDRITATGRTSIRQTDFGISPVIAAGGTVKVKDAVDITFTVVAIR